MEYPKQLYRQGWDDLTDTVRVHTPAEEEAARRDGFRMLHEPAPAPAKSGRAR